MLITWQSIKIQTDLVSCKHEWIYNVTGMIQTISVPVYFWMLLFFPNGSNIFIPTFPFCCARAEICGHGCFVSSSGLLPLRKPLVSRRLVLTEGRKPRQPSLPISSTRWDTSFTCTPKVLIQGDGNRTLHLFLQCAFLNIFVIFLLYRQCGS